MSSAPVLELFVAHEPQQVGSKNAFVVYRSEEGHGRSRRRPLRRDGSVTCQACGETDGSIIVNVTDENQHAKAFMAAIEDAARDQLAATAPVAGEALELYAIFFLKRPEAHWGTGRNAHLLKDDAPARPLTYPDEDKLLRATQDALTGVAWADDSQVTVARAEKRYAIPAADGDGQGVYLVVRRHDHQRAADLPMVERVRVPPTREPEPTGDDDSQASLLDAA